MSEPVPNPPVILADLLESLRLAGIRHLPSTVASFELPAEPDLAPARPLTDLNPPVNTGGTTRMDARGGEKAPERSEWTPVPPSTPRFKSDFEGVTAGARIPLALGQEGPGDGIGEVDSLSAGERLERLERLAEEVSRCTKCRELARGRTRTVFGVGPIDPELCVVGEAPGAEEDLRGEPFVGLAGQMLDKILKACGFERSQVYICNILRCRPPGNRIPDPAEAQNCRPFLEATLSLVKPRFLCLMGATATRHLLESSSGVGALRGRELAWRGIPAAATYHPSYLLRYPEKKRDTWEDMKRMLARMGRPVPGP